MNLEKSSLITKLSKIIALTAIVASTIVTIFVLYTNSAYQKQETEEKKEEPAIKQVIQKNLNAVENQDADAFLETVSPSTKNNVILNPTYKAIFDEQTYSHTYSDIEIELISNNKLPLSIKNIITNIKDKYNFEDIAVVTLNGLKKTTFQINGAKKTTENEIAPLTYVIKQNGNWYIY